MRKYWQQSEDRWKNILKIVRWRLERRIHDVERAGCMERRAQEVFLQDLQKSYEDSRFLHRFLGYKKETGLEQKARALLERNEMF